MVLLPRKGNGAVALVQHACGARLELGEALRDALTDTSTAFSAVLLYFYTTAFMDDANDRGRAHSQ